MTSVDVKHSRRSPWHLRPISNKGCVFRTGGNFHRPFLAPCPGVMESGGPGSRRGAEALTRPHSEVYSFTSALYPFSLFLFLSLLFYHLSSESDSNSCQHRSHRSRPLGSTYNEAGPKRWSASQEGEWALWFCRCRNLFLGSFPSARKGLGWTYCLVKHQLFTQGVWNKDPQACEFQFFPS